MPGRLVGRRRARSVGRVRSAVVVRVVPGRLPPVSLVWVSPAWIVAQMHEGRTHGDRIAMVR